MRGADIEVGGEYALTSYGSATVRIPVADFVALAERLGVETD